MCRHIKYYLPCTDLIKMYTTCITFICTHILFKSNLISEYQRFEKSRCLVNLAAGKKASQSTSYLHFVAGSGTNGNLNDFTRTRLPNSESKPWLLRVDLKKNFRIYIFNRKELLW